LIHRGPQGQSLYDEVMENASTKVVFRLTYEENLRPLAQALFMGCLDPDEIKHRLTSLKVVGYREETRDVHVRGKSRASGRTGGTSRSTGGGEGGSESFDPNLESPLLSSGRRG